jgi:4-hydroxy-2-oxoheptanedioate aldolase
VSPTDGTIATTTARLRELWAQDRPAFAVWSITSDPVVAELLAGTSFHAVIVDLQHGAATLDDLTTTAQAMRAAGRAPTVRVPWNDPVGIMRALDLGAHAVIVPMVGSAQEAAAAARACRFPPTGVRSWGPLWADVRADGALPPGEQDDAVLCLVMVETAEGVGALEEILAEPGVDGVFIGPNDLALGCGHGRSTYRDSPEVDALLERIVTACRDAGKVAGLFCSDVEMATHWAARGARLLSVAVDTALLRVAAERTWAALDTAVEVAEHRGRQPAHGPQGGY